MDAGVGHQKGLVQIKMGQTKKQGFELCNYSFNTDLKGLPDCVFFYFFINLAFKFKLNKTKKNPVIGDTHGHR